MPEIQKHRAGRAASGNQTKNTSKMAKKKQTLNPYCEGLMQADLLGIDTSALSDVSITLIGKAIISGNEIAIGKSNGCWCVHDSAKAKRFTAFYIIKGNDTIFLHPKRREKPVSKMTAVEIFNAGKGVKFRKHAPRTGLKQRMAYAARMEKF